MKGFYIYVKNDLLEPKHCNVMGSSVWLYLWLLDKITSITEEKIGSVLGGKPIKYEVIKKELDIPERTYHRWVSNLKKHNYILTKRTPYGLIIKVTKAKKVFGQQIGSAKNGLSSSAKKVGSNRPSTAYLNTQNGLSNKTRQLDKTIDKTSNTNTKVLQQAEYGNHDINKIISYLKEKFSLNILDGSDKENRRYAYHCLKKFKLDGTLQVIEVASANDFWKNHITQVKDIYYKAVKIMATKRQGGRVVKI